MNDVIGIINNTKEEKNLDNIINGRSLATIPFGGRYRLIDFTLSNMVNSGINNVGILVKKNYTSLIGHIRSPKEWDLDRKKDGLFILPPDNENVQHGTVKGDLEILNCNMNYLIKSRQKYVLISGANIICNIDYAEALKYHRENKNDITVIYKKFEKGSLDCPHCTEIKIDENKRILDMKLNSKKTSFLNMSIDMYIMKKELLIEIIKDCISKEEYDLLEDGIIKRLKDLNVYGYEFIGYAGSIRSINHYYKHSMDLINPEIWRELFFKSGTIYTKIKDLAPSKYGKDSSVKNSLVSNGCIIDGIVENSVIFRGVKIEKGAVIKNSVIMEDSSIEEGAILQNVIIDKDSLITRDKKLIGNEDYPVAIDKRTII